MENSSPPTNPAAMHFATTPLKYAAHRIAFRESAVPGPAKH
jgi:hypothetical protein